MRQGFHLFPPTPHNDPQNSIVVAHQESRTSMADNGGLISKYDTPCNHSESLDCDQLTLANEIVTLKGVRTICNSVLCHGGNMNVEPQLRRKS